MKRSRFLGLFGATTVSTAALAQPTDEAAEDAAICSFAAELINSYTRGDFHATAQRIHQAGLSLSRKVICTRYERFVERYGAERVHAASGLREHPKGLATDDLTFYVRIMELTEKRFPGFSAAPAKRALKIIGGIVEPWGDDTVAHILYDYRTVVSSKLSEVKAISPSNITLVRVQGRWLCWSALAASRPASRWLYELDPENVCAEPPT